VLQNGPRHAEEAVVADIPKSPFDRVDNGYDPQQVAAFAGEALSWKRQLAATRSELEAAKEALERYESVIGAIEDVEREAAEITDEAQRRAAEIIEQAEDEAARILEMAQDRLRSSEPVDPAPTPIEESPPEESPSQGDPWLTPEVETGAPDPVEEIFEPIEVIDVNDPETEREKRVAAAAANLWKRRGVLTQPE
jgi:chromosome segregation ATPase